MGLGTNRTNKGFLSSVGSVGSSMLIGLCPVCIPAIGAFLTSVGLGFLVTESILKPLLILLLTVAISGLAWSYWKEHRKPGALMLGSVMALAMYFGRYVDLQPTLNVTLMYGSIPGIILATIWNLRLRKASNCGACDAVKS